MRETHCIYCTFLFIRNNLGELESLVVVRRLSYYLAPALTRLEQKKSVG
jgi:hypothetical protein